jgi:hypothetical protein
MRAAVAKAAVVCIMAVALFLTYNRCVECVVCIAILSGVTMNCVPLMPLVFIMSIAVIFLHSIDYNKATFKVEVPIQDIIYVPTWSDMQKYVHLVPSEQPP